MTRRRAALALASLAAAGCGSPNPRPPEAARRAKILLRCGWQAGRFGDIAQTMGILRQLTESLPKVEVVLWPGALDAGARERIARVFPRVRIAAALEPADVLVHGSAAGLPGAESLEEWRRQTDKPYGIFGVSLAARLDARAVELLNGAAFVFARESASLAHLRRVAPRARRTGLAPDAAFSVKLSNESAARALFQRGRLASKQFLAVAPDPRTAPDDAAKLRDAIERWVRDTRYKVLLCPEVEGPAATLEALLYDPLPAPVKARVARRGAPWLPDEACSVFRRAVAVVGGGYFSPILAAANNTPFLYLPPPGEDHAGRIWQDIGLSGWFLEMAKAGGAEIARTLMDIHRNYSTAQVMVHEAVIYARKLQADAVGQALAPLL